MKTAEDVQQGWGKTKGRMGEEEEAERKRKHALIVSVGDMRD